MHFACLWRFWKYLLKRGGLEMKKYGLITLFALIFIFTAVSTAGALNFTMSWSFQSFNNPNARQVNMSLAETQSGMVEEAMDPLERFQERFERRMISSIQRSIIERIRDEDAEGPAEGSYQVGDLEISISEDQLTGEVTLDVVNIITGESTTISYSDEWLGGEF